jgi:hypothetical protein
MNAWPPTAPAKRSPFDRGAFEYFRSVGDEASPLEIGELSPGACVSALCLKRLGRAVKLMTTEMTIAATKRGLPEIVAFTVDDIFAFSFT